MRVTLPLMPVPATCDRSTSCCSASRSTAGEYRPPRDAAMPAPVEIGPPDPVGPTGATSVKRVPTRSALAWPSPPALGASWAA